PRGNPQSRPARRVKRNSIFQLARILESAVPNGLSSKGATSEGLGHLAAACVRGGGAPNAHYLRLRQLHHIGHFQPYYSSAMPFTGPEHISTNYAERQNLTMRMGMRGFTWLTNAFSKKVE